MKVSFTGTRAGMNSFQEEQLRNWLRGHKNRIVLAAHGGCIGADVQFHKVVREVCGNSLYIAWLPSTATTRAPVEPDADYVADPKSPLSRNRDIVDLGYDQLLATPKEMHEMLRSGTWSAVRYARKKKVPIEIFWPEAR